MAILESLFLLLVIIEIDLLVLCLIFPIEWWVGAGLSHRVSIARLFARQTLGAALLLKVYYFVFTVLCQLALLCLLELLRSQSLRRSNGLGKHEICLLELYLFIF